MDYRPLGKTGMEVSVIGYGAIKLPNIGFDEAEECLNRALDLDINFVDTARAYGDSEAKIGNAIADRRDEFYIATKSGARGADEAREELEVSLENLRCDYVDLWQLHSVSDGDQWEQVNAPGGAIEAGRQALDEGIIKHFGITIHRDLGVMRKAIESGIFETIMVAYSVLDQENVGPEILPLANEHEMGVIIMKSLSGGQLCRPEGARVAGLGGADAIVAGSLRYVAGNPNVSTVIPGMQRVHEVEENAPLGSPLKPLTDAEEQELRTQIGEMEGAFRYGQTCLQCGYCMPCPEGINIPEVFRAADMKSNYPDNLKYMGDELWERLDAGPEDCVECEQCVEKCPAGIYIPDKLQEAPEVFAE